MYPKQDKLPSEGMHGALKKILLRRRKPNIIVLLKEHSSKMTPNDIVNTRRLVCLTETSA